MPKKADTTAEIAENKQNTEVPEQAENAEKTVTMTEAEFEALKADMLLLKKQIASEQRLKTAAEKAQEETEAEIERIRAANEKAEELVTVHVEMGSLRGKKNLEVSINGVQYLVNRGVDVKVPRKVAEVIENSMKQREAAFGLQDRRAAEAERAFASGALTV